MVCVDLLEKKWPSSDHMGSPGMCHIKLVQFFYHLGGVSWFWQDFGQTISRYVCEIVKLGAVLWEQAYS